jgi:hypothetical protein
LYRQDQAGLEPWSADTVSVDLPHKCISSSCVQSEKLEALGISVQAKAWEVFFDKQKKCLYKPKDFAWNGTLPSKQSVVSSGSRGSTG